MRRATSALVRRWLDVLLHVDDTDERTAAAYALGVFFGFSPFLGLHTVLALTLAFAFNLNRVAVLLGVYSNLPWIILPYYISTTMTVSAITGAQLPPDFRERLASLFDLSFFESGFWEHLATIIRPLLWPYLAGSTLGALVLSLVAYRLALAFVVRRHRRRMS
jgi:uncharacterized protein (DUF2062 family)